MESSRCSSCTTPTALSFVRDGKAKSVTLTSFNAGREST